MKSNKASNKVLLIRPFNPVVVSEHVMTPLGLLSLAAVLKKNKFNVKIIDAMVEPNYKQKILEEAKDALIVGIGVWTSEIKSAYEITKLIKEKYDIPIVWGGWHATLFPQQIIENSMIDYVIINEGEYSLLDLVKALKKNNKKNLNKIPGLFYKEKGRIKSNPRKGNIDLNTLPDIDFSLIDVERYINEKISNKNYRALPYESSRGCPHRCAFCINVVANNMAYRTKTVKKTVDGIEHLIKKYNLSYIFFQEDNFFVNRERVIGICNEILKRKLKFNWFAECRANYFKPEHISKEIFQLAKNAGLHTLSIGAESGSSLTLAKIKKDINVEQTINSAKICNEVGIIPVFSFIIGFPHEKMQEIYKTIDLALKLKRICPSMSLSVGSFFPYPRCEIVEEMKKEHTFKEPKKLEEWFDDYMIKLYTEVYYYPPWQDNPRKINNICYYFYVISSYNDVEVKELIRKMKIKYFPYIFFRFLAEQRLKHKFFSLNIDRFLFEKLKKIYGLIRKS